MKIYNENINWEKDDDEYKYSDGIHDGNILVPMDKTKKYPILYLLHGMGAAKEWQHNNIAGNMNRWIEKYGLEPMVIVMPSLPKYGKSKYNADTYLRYVHNDLKNLVDFIAEKYGEYILTGAENTAIAGASMGGTGALYAAVLYSDTFMHVGAISPGQQLYIEEGHGWISEADKLRLNEDERAAHFIGYSEKEPDEFGEYARRYWKVFGDNGFEIIECVVEDRGHCYTTFNHELELFLKENIFR